MYQVAFTVDEFPRLVPWLMLNREGLECPGAPADRRQRRRSHPICALARLASAIAGRGVAERAADRLIPPTVGSADRYIRPMASSTMMITSDKPEPATRVISPSAAISPGRQRADQQDDQNYQKDRAQAS